MKISQARLLALIFVLGAMPGAFAQDTVGRTTFHTIKKIGTAHMGGVGSSLFNSTSRPRVQPDRDLVIARRESIAKGMAATANAVAATLTVPAPRPKPLRVGRDAVGFPGLTTVDTANTNGFVLSPPDQGLCVGNGFVVEPINLVLTAYNKTGAQLTTPVSINAFFGADPSVTFLSDPRCYYDRPTQRWFMSVTNVVNSSTNRSNLYLAVSQTSDPTQAFTIYSIDTTDDGVNGTPNNPNCPCFGDQPLLGADAFGIYLSTNEFPLFTGGFNGAQIYAISKLDLEAGTASSLVHIGNLPLAEGIAYSVQPATSPDLHEEDDSGVEYFLSALDFTGTLDNRIAAWALTNTRSLAQASPNVSLSNVVINSEVYGQPPLATQKAGPYPLGQSLGDPEELLNSDDDRMQQVTFSQGHLWGALCTVVSDGTNQNAGVAYFWVKVRMKAGILAAAVKGESYVSVRNASLLYPAVGVTADGSAGAAFTLTGPGYYPSAAFSFMSPTRDSSVNVVAVGGAPQDDFSGYPQYGGGGDARWGDYSAAVADGDSLWLATEYIPGDIDSTAYFTNFGTFVYKVRPPSME
jgi:hypothetical protein